MSFIFGFIIISHGLQLLGGKIVFKQFECTKTIKNIWHLQ